MQQFDYNGNYQDGFGVSGSGNGQFNGPNAAFVASSSATFSGLGITLVTNTTSLYVIDNNNNRVEVMGDACTFPGPFCSGWLYAGQWGGAGSGNGTFSLPNGIASDGTYFYVADWGNGIIQKFDFNGVFQTQWAGSGGTGGNQLSSPSDLAIDPINGHVVVADSGYNRIAVFTNTGGAVRKWGKNGGDGTSGNGNGEFNSPTGLDVDTSGNVYVADWGNHRIQKFSATGSFISKYGTLGSGPGNFNHPTDVAVDSSVGVVFVSDTGNNRIVKLQAQ